MSNSSDLSNNTFSSDFELFNPSTSILPESFVDLTSSPDPLPGRAFTESSPQFNTNHFQDFSSCNEFITQELINSDWPFFQSINLPDTIHDCLSFHDFLYRIDFSPINYNIHQFFIDYIYFLENILCLQGFSNSLLFQTFLDFLSSKQLYEFNQLCYIYNHFDISKSSESLGDFSSLFNSSPVEYCPFSGF